MPSTYFHVSSAPIMTAVVIANVVGAAIVLPKVKQARSHVQIFK